MLFIVHNRHSSSPDTSLPMTRCASLSQIAINISLPFHLQQLLNAAANLIINQYAI